MISEDLVLPAEARNYNVTGADSLHQRVDRVVGSVGRDRVDVRDYLAGFIDIVDGFLQDLRGQRDRNSSPHLQQLLLACRPFPMAAASDAATCSVQHITAIPETCPDVIGAQAWIVRKDIGFAPALCQQVDDELHGQPGFRVPRASPSAQPRQRRSGLANPCSQSSRLSLCRPGRSVHGTIARVRRIHNQRRTAGWTVDRNLQSRDDLLSLRATDGVHPGDRIRRAASGSRRAP